MLRKAEEIPKAKASIIQESGSTTDIMIILIFHISRHLLGNNIASLLHTVNIIFCSLSSHVPAVTAVTVSRLPDSPGPPAEATTAARNSLQGWKPSCASSLAASLLQRLGQLGSPWSLRVPRDWSK